MERYALTFPVRPGTEDRVRHLLGSYPRPATEVAGGGRLLGTSVFFWCNHVVRVLDVDGPFAAVMRHLAADPAVRATEERLNPLLLRPRHLGDPAAMAGFFRRAGMTRFLHREPDDSDTSSVPARRTRVALRYPVRPGCGRTLARAVARAAARPSREGPAPVRTTVFRHGDLVLEVCDVVGSESPTHADRALFQAGDGISSLLDPGWDLSTSSGRARLLEELTLPAVVHRDAGDGPS